MATLRTDRLALLGFSHADYAPEFKSKKAIRELLQYAPPETVIENLSEGLTFYCISLTDQAWVGNVTFSWQEDERICSLGYSIHPPFRRRGYATEAARAAMEWIIATDVEATFSETFSDWRYSIRVMEKAGLRRIEADLGPLLVRYGFLKNGSTVDLKDHAALTLAPFCDPPLQTVLRYFGWVWRDGEILGPLLVLLAITFACRNQGWIALAAVSFAIYRVRGFVIWWPKTRFDTYLQFREGGLFWASRDGSGGSTPWSTFSFWRAPKRKGLELWNGRSWYWIRPEALVGVSLETVQKFLTEHGVPEGEPPKAVHENFRLTQD